MAYLLAALVVLAVPPKAGARAEGTAAWWIAGSALFVTYVLLSLLLRVRPCLSFTLTLIRSVFGSCPRSTDLFFGIACM